MTSTEEQRPWIWTKRAMELSFAACFIIGGAVCFGMGFRSREELFQEFADDLGAITNETGLFLFGGVALILVGLGGYLLGPSGIRIDAESREVSRWRGLWPRLRESRLPFSEVERIIVVKRWYVANRRRRIVYDLNLAIPGTVLALEFNRDSAVIKARATALAELIGAPIEEEERQPRGR